ncbi:basic helix-loop-helix domain-containing protein [Aspergillus undulatus]|uniref:basic helix-loop-helix domain-containing protein n=1 Tax=Aspergillus undulatus TaxID=1810928 RepID=UPI003CCD50E8
MMSIDPTNGTQGRNERNNSALPFGYSFPADQPCEPAPQSPLGLPLLDVNETNMLDTFLTTIDNNAFANDFWFTGSQNDTNKSLGFPGFDWSTELPPTFEGSTSSLPVSFPQRSADKPLDILPEQSNPDVVAAASMLYQNAPSGVGYNNPFGNQPVAFSSIDYSQFKGNGKEQQHNGPPPVRRTSISTRTHLPAGYHTTKMFFDVHEPISPERQLSTKVRPLHWGSDSSFMDQGYVAPPDVPNEEQRTKELMENLECLEPQSSAANTRAPTPDRLVNYRPVSWVDTGAAAHANGLRKDYGDSIENLSHPKKKQRLSIKEEDDEVSDGDSSRQRSKRSKGSGRRPSTDANRKSRASQSSKPPRENLTEEQKRSNHIKSEQKRRNLIKEGFDDLCILVPGLKGGGFSKSAMLTQAADWLEEMLRGNEALKIQLADLKTMNHGIMMPR